MNFVKIVTLAVFIILFTPCLKGSQIYEEETEELRDAAPPLQRVAAKSETQPGPLEASSTETPAYMVSQPLSGDKPKGERGFKPMGHHKLTTHENCLVALQFFSFMSEELSQKSDMLVQRMHAKKKVTPGLIKRATKLAKIILAYHQLSKKTYTNILLKMINASEVPDYKADLNTTCWIPVLSKDCSADGGVHFANFNNVPTAREYVDNAGYKSYKRYRIRIPSIAVPVMWNVDCKMMVVATAYRTQQPERVIFTNEIPEMLDHTSDLQVLLNGTAMMLEGLEHGHGGL